MASSQETRSVLIVGAGVFGLSTAYALACNPNYKDEIIVVDKWPGIGDPESKDVVDPRAASNDTSRIIRTDYTNPVMSRLAAEAHERWRGDWGRDGRFHETGWVFVAGEDDHHEDKHGQHYIEKARRNAAAITEKGGAADNISMVSGLKELAEMTGFPLDQTQGQQPVSYANWKGYCNRTSGWADANASMQYLHELVIATNRVKFFHGSVAELVYRPDARAQSGYTIAGVRLEGPERRTIYADLTVLAAGPHTPGLVDLRGICEARGQVLAYVQLTPDELKRYNTDTIRVFMVQSEGMFVIGPDQQGRLKFCRQAYGYRNPTVLQVGKDSDFRRRTGDNHRPVVVSIPDDSCSGFDARTPWDGEAACHAFKQKLFPNSPIGTRPFVAAKTCYYADTPTGNFVISYHPDYAHSLFIATGDSGHGFKFLPVLGEKIMALLEAREGNLDATSDDAHLRDLWRFPATRGPIDEPIFCEDGSRRGPSTMKFHEKMAEGRKERARL